MDCNFAFLNSEEEPGPSAHNLIVDFAFLPAGISICVYCALLLTHTSVLFPNR